MREKKPSFVIVGAMKSATTTLYEQLVKQPGIYMPSLKEPNFFSDDGQYGKGLQWYLELFDESQTGDILGEASTHYTKLPTYPETLSRMAASLVSPKIIYVMRDPMERLVSQYIHEWSQGVISMPIDDAIEACPELIQYSQYHYQIAPYIERFGTENVLPVFFEQIKANPELVLSRVCDFIGYKGEPQWHFDLAPSNVSSQRIRRFPLYDILIESRPFQWLRRTLIPQGVRDRVKQRLTMTDRPQLSESSKNRATMDVDSDLLLLGEKLGVHLTCENFKDVVTNSVLEWR